MTWNIFAGIVAGIAFSEIVWFGMAKMRFSKGSRYSTLLVVVIIIATFLMVL